MNYLANALLTEDYKNTFNKYPSNDELSAWATATFPITSGQHLMEGKMFELLFPSRIHDSSKVLNMQYDELFQLIKSIATEFYILTGTANLKGYSVYLGKLIPQKYKKHKELIGGLVLHAIQIVFRAQDRGDTFVENSSRPKHAKWEDVINHIKSEFDIVLRNTDTLSDRT